MGSCLVVIRIRGRANVPKPIEDTLRFLRLTRVNHATLIPSNPSIIGMLRRASNHIAWGEVSKESVLSLLKNRAELEGGIRLTEGLLKEKLGFESFDKLADFILERGMKVRGLKPIFRLHPPRKGFKKSIKRTYGAEGECGYRKDINELLSRMI